MGVGPSAISDTVDRKHRTVRRLGAGNFGIVSAVESVSTGEAMARKDLHLERWDYIRQDMDLLRTACAGAFFLASLRHEHIVRLLDYKTFLDQDAICVYMELCDTNVGEFVNQFVSEGQKLPGSTLVHITMCVLKALEYLHSQEVMHRVLKPQNILLRTQDGNRQPIVKISDFGVGLIHMGVNDYIFAPGNRPYMAPEVFTGFREREAARVTMAADLWSLGVTIEELCEHTEPGRRRNALLSLAKKCKARDPTKRPSAKDARLILARTAGGPLSRLRWFAAALIDLSTFGRLLQILFLCPGSILGGTWMPITWSGMGWSMGTFAVIMVWKYFTGQDTREEKYSSWFALAAELVFTYIHLTKAMKYPTDSMEGIESM